MSLQNAKILIHQKEFQIKLGQQIAKLRKEKKLTQVEFAYLLAKEKQNYKKLEKGKTNPTISKLYKITELLNVPISE